jgi:HAD superfamily hydrolase (TIGR01509 family)
MVMTRVSLRLPAAALIFDMDGVLADTEPLHVEAWLRTLRDFDPAAVYEQRTRMTGMSSPVIAAALVRELGLDVSAAELLRRKRAAWEEIAHRELQPFAGLGAEIARFSGLPRGLATSSTRTDVDFMLGRLGLAGSFSPIVTCDDVVEAKPAPDVYREAARLLGLPASSCLVIEDSPNGIRAAVAAGTQVLAVSPHPVEELPPGVLRVFATTVEALQWLRS